MIAYTVAILSVWIGSIFVPFFFCGFDHNEDRVHRENTHFLKG